MSLSSIPLPDTRFEQSFMKSLRTYATNFSKKDQPKHLSNLDPSQIDSMNKSLDTQEQQELSQPLPPPITPSIVAYAVIKDQIIMPLLQGLLWTGILILSRPTLRLIVHQGHKCGVYLSTILGLNRSSFSTY